MPVWLYRIICLGAVVGFTYLGVLLGRDGRWEFALLPIVVSPLSMLVLRISMEYGLPEGIFSPKTQSWAFLFGDAFYIPLAFLGGALSWRRIAAIDGFHHQKWWLWLSIAIGALAGVAFRYVLNAPDYRAAGLDSLLDSPTSIWHDFVVYPVLVGLFVYICLPAVAYDTTNWGWLALVGLLGWGAMGAHDATHPLDLRNLHPPVEKTILRR